MLHLAVQYASGRDAPTRAQVRRWVQRALAVADPSIASATLTVRFVDEAEARALNATYRQRDYPTNVLTFADDAPRGRRRAIEADIVLCTQVVEREAIEQRKELRDHYAHLVVHGALHAVGYDHEDEVDADRMEAVERGVLARFRIRDPYAAT